MLAVGFHAVPRGHVATVVTYLEMRAPAAPRPCPAPENTTIRRIPAPDVDWYRDLFVRVGGQDWMWFSRLRMEADKLAAILSDPEVHVMVLERDGAAMGLLELDFRKPGDCELAFFGVTPEMIGTAAGRYLMNDALARAWAAPIRRFHLHTCTLDHHRALDFYRRSGFAPTHQQVEILRDPRLTGDLPADAAPHVPIFR